MEGLFFLIGKLWQFFAPMFEADLNWVKVEVLNVVIVRIHDLFEESSTLKIHLFVILVNGCYAGRPDEGINESVGNKFLLVLAVLACLEATFNAAHNFEKIGKGSNKLNG